MVNPQPQIAVVVLGSSALAARRKAGYPASFQCCPEHGCFACLRKAVRDRLRLLSSRPTRFKKLFHLLLSCLRPGQSLVFVRGYAIFIYITDANKWNCWNIIPIFCCFLSDFLKGGDFRIPDPYPPPVRSFQQVNTPDQRGFFPP